MGANRKGGAKGATVLLQCRQCHHPTNHEVLYVDHQSGHSDEHDVWWEEENSLVRCLGCDNVALYRCSTNSESLPDEIKKIFPDPEQGREPIDDYIFLPRQLRKIYLETLQALDGKQAILAGIGIRAIIEMVCKERKASGANLEKKIDDLQSQGVLTLEGVKLLHKLRVIGNRAAHEAKPHSSRELSVAIDVVNHLLLGVYILPMNADETFE